MTADLLGDLLVAGLDAAAADGRRVAFWWRDDDAVAPTPALDRLLGLAESLGLPLVLASIPAGATAALAQRLERADPGIRVAQHGFSHTSHARPPAKKAELGADRPAESVLAELATGRARLETLFGPRFLPVLVPPWNRIAPAVAAGRAEIGLPGLSVHASLTRDGHRLDTHIDPVDWHGSRSLAGADFLGERIGAAFAERERPENRAVPVGLLTHHLMHDDGLWEALERALPRIAGHPAAVWPEAEALFSLPPGRAGFAQVGKIP